MKSLYCFLGILCAVFSLKAQTIDIPFNGDYADPSVVRVGDDFYMTHTSFSYYPGLLIWHSKDLKNWEPVCRALNQNVGIVWAPDLVYYKNKFYIYFPTDSRKNYVITADRIEGPWSDPVCLDVQGIDPGHIADEKGNRYLYVSEGRYAELTRDGLKVKSKEKEGYSGWQYPEDWVVECFCLESPKLMYHNGYYYLTSAQGGTSGPATSHMAVVARSRSCTGPWENSPYNPLVHTYNPYEPWISKGHGTLFDDTEGNWYVAYHAYNSDNRSLGRSTLIEKVEWTTDGWPKVTTGNPEAMVYNIIENNQLEPDDFSSDKLHWQWCFWGVNSMNDYALTNGKLKIKGSEDKTRALMAISPNRDYEVVFKIETEGDVETGVVLFYNDQEYTGIGLKNNVIYGLSRGKKAWTEIPVSNCKYLKLRVEKSSVFTYYSENGTDWKTYPHGFDVSGNQTNMLSGFLSLKPSVLCKGNGSVYVDSFSINKLP